MDDETLVEMTRKKHGHQNEAFAELYRRHLDGIYRYVLIQVGEIQDAQDITAQTFINALKNLTSYRGDSFAAWLFGIARNKIADHFRRRRYEISLNEEMSDWMPALENLIDSQLTLERLRTALNALPVDRAEALTLHIFGGLSYAEVGRVMNRSEDAAKMLAHRALTDLRHRLRVED
jgi:RNA polymerase sigma-70 factor, ECF subfamily